MEQVFCERQRGSVSQYSSSWTSLNILSICQIFHLKWTKFSFVDPAGEPRALPRPPSWICWEFCCQVCECWVVCRFSVKRTRARRHSTRPVTSTDHWSSSTPVVCLIMTVLIEALLSMACVRGKRNRAKRKRLRLDGNRA